MGNQWMVNHKHDTMQPYLASQECLLCSVAHCLIPHLATAHPACPHSVPQPHHLTLAALHLPHHEVHVIHSETVGNVQKGM